MWHYCHLRLHDVVIAAGRFLPLHPALALLGAGIGEQRVPSVAPLLLSALACTSACHHLIDVRAAVQLRRPPGQTLPGAGVGTQATAQCVPHEAARLLAPLLSSNLGLPLLPSLQSSALPPLPSKGTLAGLAPGYGAAPHQQRAPRLSCLPEVTCLQGSLGNLFCFFGMGLDAASLRAVIAEKRAQRELLLLPLLPTN